MCGIIGLFNVPAAEQKVTETLSTLAHRGRDHYGFATQETIQHAPILNALHVNPTTNVLGHCLHAIVGTVAQPLKKKSILAANCEIYNWKQLARNHSISAQNDAELLHELLEHEPLSSVLEKIDGDYAFVHWNGDTITIARDRIGVKPLWYSTENKHFAVASERKALSHLGYQTIHELNPRTILTYNLTTHTLHSEKRPFYTLTPEHTTNYEDLKQITCNLLTAAVTKRIPEQSFGLLFSGGIDSTVLAKLCTNARKEFTCYTAVVDDPTMSTPPDLLQAQHTAQLLDLHLKIIRVTLDDIEKTLPLIANIIEDTNVTKIGVALPFYFAAQAAAHDNIKVLFSGLGSEELFAGYERHKNSTNINNECLSGFRKLYERDLYRDDTITMYHTVELRVPYLDHALIQHSLKIPTCYKITTEQNKIILRDIANDMGIPKELSTVKKRAAQYGSNFDKALTKLAKKNGYRTKSAYLHSFCPKPNLHLGVLFSSGKDSMYALHLMHQQNYTISCLITLQSTNKDSFMFHTPNIHLATVQADALQIPIIIQETEGKQDDELADLKKALRTAQQRYNINGIVTGALFSTYQRDRIETLCDDLGLKIFSPLWHKNQETELQELLDQHYDIIISSIASEGFTKEWLGKKLTPEMLIKLHYLHVKYGINPSFEGGEAETFVLDAPLFKKKIIIDKAEQHMYDTYSGIYNITSVRLEEKN